MPIVDIAGIATHYEVSGSGPPILLMAPGGFDSAIENGLPRGPGSTFCPSRPLPGSRPVLPMTVGKLGTLAAG